MEEYFHKISFFSSSVFEAAEAKKVKAKKLKAYLHQQQLQLQILEKEKRAKKIEMSQAEESINKDLLEHCYKELQKKKVEA